MNVKKFQPRKEDFVCEVCGTKVIGNGYTNHCPKCLWSKHVDINPGDRKSNCGGMMEPIRAEIKNSSYVIIHKCKICKFIKKNKSSEDDNFEAILTIMTKKDGVK